MRDNFYGDVIFFGYRELIQVPIFLLVIISLAFIYKHFHISRSSGGNLGKVDDSALDLKKMYRFFYPALLMKLSGVVMLSFIYLEIYGLGDTVAYFESSSAIANVFYESPATFFDIIFGEASQESLNRNFSEFTYRPYQFLYLEPRTCMVLRLTSPLVILSGGSMLVTGLYLSFISFICSWKLYQVLCELYPKYVGALFIPVLMMPSVAFWSTGVLKDTYTYIGLCLFIYGFYKLAIRRSISVGSIFMLLMGGFLIVTIKPYILFGLLPACLVWNYHHRLMKMRGFVMKMLALPMLILLFAGIMVVFFTYFGNTFEKFGVDQALNTAAVTQNDLKQDYYGGQSFDIGAFDGSPQRALELFFPAVIAGIFRPMIYEVRTPLMLLSAIENLYLVFLLVSLVRYTANPFTVIKTIARDPVISSFLIFTILFAFLVGLSTSNFGALVRFKVPLIPVYGAAMVILAKKLKERRNQKYLASQQSIMS
jgi:hypothetical protein